MTSASPIKPAAPDLPLLQAVLDIARTASTAIMSVYDNPDTVASITKEDNSPLTEADRQAHRLITLALQQLTPDIPVLSEESPSEQHAAATRKQWPTLWLVDPLDGTREFLKRNGEFTVNIALIHQHRPTLGVITAPALNLAWSGIPGRGAWRCPLAASSTHDEIHIRPCAQPPVVVGSRSHRGDSLDTLLARLGNSDLQAVGSALKFCRVAEGRADLYPRLSPTSEWDTAAGQAILEAAGGQVLTLDGLPMRYNQRDTLLNPAFIAVGDTAFNWQRLL